MTTPEPATYRRHRFPAEVVSHAVWLHHVFSLNLRGVELLLVGQGIAVSRVSVRRWCLKAGEAFAGKLRSRRSRPGHTWHLDEVFIRSNGVPRYLWRAVDRHGAVLDIPVQSGRNGNAAKRFCGRSLAGLKCKLRLLVTGGLRSYGVARRERSRPVTWCRSDGSWRAVPLVRLVRRIA